MESLYNKNIKKEQRFSAPIFEFGEGCAVNAPPGSFAMFIEIKDALNIIESIFTVVGLKIKKIQSEIDPYSYYLMKTNIKLLDDIYQHPEMLNKMKRNDFSFHAERKELNNLYTYIENPVAFKIPFLKKKLTLFKKREKFPVFFNAFCPQLNLAIKYVTDVDCKIYDRDFIDKDGFEFYQCRKIAHKIKNTLIKQGKSNIAIFYDPVAVFNPFDDNMTEDAVKNMAIESLKKQVKSFLDWIEQKNEK